jgi:S-adenosyl methyltransferase
VQLRSPAGRSPSRWSWLLKTVGCAGVVSAQQQPTKEIAAVSDRSPTPSHGVEPVEIDTTVPHSARVWNYWLGGKDNYPIDRAAGDQFREVYPGIVDVTRASRRFLTRAVRYLTGEAGIRQFLDVGTGLPTAENTHQVAQRVAPESRIVYVDNDPVVLTHARALLTSTPQGVTDYVDADLRQPDDVLETAARTLDLRRPVALMLMGIMGHVTDDNEARSIVKRLMDALPSGSYLALYDGTDTNPAGMEAQEEYNRSGAAPYRLRSPEQIAGFFEGLELLEPGVVPPPQWRPDPTDADAGLPPEVDALCGVARKPEAVAQRHRAIDAVKAEIHNQYSPARIAHRAMVWVVDCSTESGEPMVEAILPQWRPRQAVRFPAALIPKDLQPRNKEDWPNMRYVAKVNIGAERAEDLYFEDFESAVGPDDDDELA